MRFVILPEDYAPWIALVKSHFGLKTTPPGGPSPARDPDADDLFSLGYFVSGG